METTDVPTVLPRELRLGVPPKMPQSRSYLFRQQSVNATYKPTNTITINLPRLQRSYLRKDSYLRFRVNGFFTPTSGITEKGVNNEQSLCLDTPGAYSLFDRIEVFDYLGSTVLETISGINACTALLLDLGLREFISGTTGNAAAGLGQDFSYNGSPTYGPGGPDLPLRKNAVLTNAGVVTAATTGAVLASGLSGVKTAFSKEFAIPLPSFLGFLSDKMVPLHNGFTIVLTLADTKVPFLFSASDDPVVIVSAATPSVISTQTFLAPNNTEPDDTKLNWFLSDVYMNCQILELGPVAESMILSSTQGAPLVVASKSFRQYVQTVKGADWTGAKVPQTTEVNAPAVTAGTYTIDVAQPPTATKKAINFTTVNTPAGLVDSINQALLAANVGVQAVLSNNKIQYFSTNMQAFTFTQNGTSITPANAGVSGPSSTNAASPNSTGQSEFILNMNLNVASLTNILWTMRPQDQLNSLLFSSLGNRTRNFLHRWYFQYGSTSLPQSNGIECFGTYIPSDIGANLTNTLRYNLLAEGGVEGFQELIKARPHYLPSTKFDNSSFYRDLIFDKTLDPRSDGTGIATLNLAGVLPSAHSSYGLGRFACGLNLQLAHNKDQQIISGLNTNGMNTSIRGIFHPLYTDNMAPVQVDAWAEFDSFINISPGIATTVSF